MMTSLDRALAVRTAQVMLALAALAFAVGVATDEATASWGDRVTRLAVTLPILGALSVAIVAAQLDHRGELTAAMLVGASRACALRGAVVLASMVGVGGAIAVAAGLPLGSLFPMTKSSGWHLSDGAFVVLPASVGASPLPRTWTAVSAALLSMTAPTWVVHPCRSGERGLIGGLALLISLVTFHAAAAGHPAFWLVLGPLVPGLHVWVRLRGSQVILAR